MILYMKEPTFIKKKKKDSYSFYIWENYCEEP